jgi:predicted phosphate transport protein (TIGR00153 family)
MVGGSSVSSPGLAAVVGRRRSVSSSYTGKKIMLKGEKLALFSKTKLIQGMIDDFLDKVSDGGMTLEQGMAAYLAYGGEDVRCVSKVRAIRALEVEGNRLRRTIETHLYAEMLIPDLRADVLALLESLTFLLGLVEDILLAITVEKPEVDTVFKEDFKLLTTTSVKTMEAAVLAARAFFRNIAAVRDHLNKVGFHEEEADQIATRLKQALFASELGLDRKLHLRYFVDKIDNLADEAEETGDHLAIYSIKRSL